MTPLDNFGERHGNRPTEPATTAPYESVFDDGVDADGGQSSDMFRGGGGSPGRLVSRYYLKLSPPHLTYFFVICNLIVFALSIWVGWRSFGIFNGYESIDVLVVLGAKVNQLIALGEWWRLFTAMFLHVGILHLLFNLYAIFAIGSLVESYYGHLRFALIYLFGGLVGSLASYAFSANISAGASGAVFAIAAAAAVYFFRYRENFGAQGRAILQNMLFVLGANLVFGMISDGIDNWGHFGGMIGGLLLGFVLVPHYASPAPAMLPEAVVEVVPSAAPLRVFLAAAGLLSLLWLGTDAATSHWICGSWLGC